MEESNEVREKKKRKIIDVRRKELEKRIRKRVGEGGRIRGTRMRKVDREVYTVRRDLINPPKLLSLRLSLSYTEGCAMFADDFVLPRAGQVSSNGLFRPK